MAITTSGTSITFNDATTQTTAPVNTNANVTSATAVAGTGISVTAVTTTGAATHTITNTGVTSIVAGTGISVSGATGAVTVTNSSPGTTYSAGNGIGISGSTISVAAPSFNSIGSYAFVVMVGTNSAAATSATSGSNYAVGTGAQQLCSFSANHNGGCSAFLVSSNPYQGGGLYTNNLSGTWKWLGNTFSYTYLQGVTAIAVRVA